MSILLDGTVTVIFSLPTLYVNPNFLNSTASCTVETAKKSNPWFTINCTYCFNSLLLKINSTFANAFVVLSSSTFLTFKLTVIGISYVSLNSKFVFLGSLPGFT